MTKDLLERLFVFMREKLRSWTEAVVQLVVDQAAHGARVDVREGLHVGGEAGPGVARPEDVGGGGEGGLVAPAQLGHHQAGPPVGVLAGCHDVRAEVVSEVDGLTAPAAQQLPHLPLNINN